MVSEEKLQSILADALKEQKDEIIKEFKKELKSLSAKVDKIKKTADDALKLAKQNETNIERVSASIDDINEKYELLQTEHNTLQVRAAVNDHKIKALEDKLEDSTNRHLRKTLVFKGVKERENESWKMTESVLAQTISDATDGSVDESVAARMIERAHRSRPNQQKKGRRDIFVKVYDWKDSEYLKEAFSKKNTRDHEFKIYCEQKYGPVTSARRNEALKARKTLKANGDIARGFVAYPAKLMVKLPGDGRDVKYKLHEDFSNIDITPEMLVRHQPDAENVNEAQ